MTIVMSAEDRVTDLLHIVSTCLDNMLHIPVDQTLFGFAKAWLDIKKKPKHLNVLTDPNALAVVALAGITVKDAVFFDSDDFEVGEDLPALNTMFKYDVTYTYGDMFVALFVATHKLFELLPLIEQEDEDSAEQIREACHLTDACYLILRPDSMKKIMSIDDMDSVAAMALAWKEVLDSVGFSDDGEVETEEDEEDEEGDDE